MSNGDRRKLHETELMIALDYLLNHSNEKHPIFIKELVLYAEEKYDVDLDRKVMGIVLSFIKDFSDEHSDKIPFVVKKTSGNRYYLKQKYNMSNEETSALLDSIKNSKYVKEENKEDIVNSILDVFSNEFDKNAIKKQLKSKRIKYQKVQPSNNLEMVKKALQEDKMLLEIMSIDSGDGKRFVKVAYYYKVYKIIEYNNRPHAFLLQTNMENMRTIKFNLNFILRPIDEMHQLDVLDDENKDNWDYNELFKKNFPKEYSKYKSIDNYINTAILPKSGNIKEYKFYFPTVLVKIIRRSFLAFFNEVLCYKDTTVYELEKRFNIDVKNKDLKYVLVEMKADYNAFLAWGYSDPHNEGFTNIFDMINIIEPTSIKTVIKQHYEKLLEKYK